MKQFKLGFAFTTVILTLLALGVVAGGMLGTTEPSSGLSQDVAVIATEASSLYRVSTANASTTDLESRLIELYQSANPSVVYIITSSGSGSGFVYSRDGYIVTMMCIFKNC